MFTSPLEQFVVVSIVLMHKKIDFSLVNVILPLIIILFLVFNSFIIIKKNCLLIPSAKQYIIESFFDFIFGIIKQQIGKMGYIHFPIISTIFIFILLSNYISLLPFGIASTSHIIITLFLSSSMCFSIFLLGLFVKKLLFFRHFIPECPLLLLPLLILIELFSYTLRSFSLAIRLSANILAGHTLVYIVAAFILSIVSVKILFFPLGFLLLFPILILEFSIAFLQAYVYSILICIYINEIYHH